MPSDDLSDLSDLSSSENIPDFEIDSIARCLLPKILAFFDTIEGQSAFEEWKKSKTENT